jgi:putative mRNA 3-end processing factor
VHWCVANGISAKPLHMLGYGDEEEAGVAAAESAA